MSPPDDFFETPLSHARDAAVQIALEAQSGEIGDAAEAAYSKQIEKSLAQTGMTLVELDRLGAPRTWLGRLAEQVADWWYDTFKAPKAGANDLLDAALFMPVPLLQTKALQDTPYGYDEAYEHMAAAETQIAAAITAGTGWTPRAVPQPQDLPDEEFDDFEEDMLGLIRAAWEHAPSGGLLLLCAGLDEDPKIMGLTLGLSHLTGVAAETLRAKLAS